LIVLHSSGVGSYWSLGKYAGLWERRPDVIAGVLYRDFRIGREDATKGKGQRSKGKGKGKGKGQRSGQTCKVKRAGLCFNDQPRTLHVPAFRLNLASSPRNLTFDLEVHLLTDL